MTTEEIDAKKTVDQQSNGWTPAIVGSLSACIAGGLISYFVLNSLTPIFPFPDLPELGLGPPPELVQKYHDAEYAFRSNNGAVDCGIIGLCVGAMMGLFTVQSRRFLSLIAGGLGGLLGGAIAGYSVGQFVAQGLIVKTDMTLLHSTLFHLAIWCSIAIGLALAICLVHPNAKQSLAALIAAVVSGALASISYNALGSTLFPFANLALITPTAVSELILWIASSSIALGLGFGLGMRKAKPKVIVYG